MNIVKKIHDWNKERLNKKAIKLEEKAAMAEEERVLKDKVREQEQRISLAKTGKTLEQRDQERDDRIRKAKDTLFNIGNGFIDTVGKMTEPVAKPTKAKKTKRSKAKKEKYVEAEKEFDINQNDIFAPANDIFKDFGRRR